MGSAKLPEKILERLNDYEHDNQECSPEIAALRAMPVNRVIQPDDPSKPRPMLKKSKRELLEIKRYRRLKRK